MVWFTHFIVLSLVICVKAHTVLRPKVIGGSKVPSKTTYPFMLSLKANGGLHFCGGTLIGNKWVLTAAHCFEDKEVSEDLFVVSGTTQINEGGKPHFVEKIIRHPDYDSQGGFGNDVALLKLKDEVHYSASAQPTRLARRRLPDGVEATVIGFGYTDPDIPLPSINLQELTQKSRSYKYCQRFFGPHIAIPSTLCLLSEPNTGACLGDSGGPLLYKNEQVGIVSVGPKPCAKKGHPVIYTDVSVFNKWISNEMKKNE